MIRIGLVGTGYISGVHASAARELDDVSITSVYSREEKKANAFAKKFGIPYAFCDFDKFLRSDRVDAVIIAVPTPLHKDFSLRAIESSKHVLCEKPISLNVDDGIEISESAAGKGVVFMVAHVIRFWPEYVRTKELIDSGLLGKIRDIYAYRFGTVPGWSADNWLLDPSKSGGVPVDLQIHDVDFIRWVLGDPLSTFAAGTRNDKGLVVNSSCIFRYHDCTAVAEAGYILPEHAKFEMGFRIIADSAVVDYNNLRGQTLIITRGDGPGEPVPVGSKDAYAEQLAHFAACVSSGKNSGRIETAEAVASLSSSLRIKSLIESSTVQHGET